MTNLFKTRYLPNPDGTESTTALTNVNTVFIHTYLGDDSTGNGTREKPYRSMTKALTKAGAYILFRGLINEYVNVGISRTIIGDDVNQTLIQSNYSPFCASLFNMTTDVGVTDVNGYLYYGKVIFTKSMPVSNSFSDNNLAFILSLSNLTYSLSAAAGYNASYGTFKSMSMGSSHGNYASVRYKNSIAYGIFGLYTGSSIHKITYCVLPQSVVYKLGGVNIVIPALSTDSKANVQLIRNAFLAAGLSSSLAANSVLFPIDTFGNETCQMIKEERDGGVHKNIFNKYGDILTGTLTAAITANSAKTSITLTVTDSSKFPATGDIFIPNSGSYTANGITIANGFEVFTYTSRTINSATSITLTGSSYTFKVAHSTSDTCKLYLDPIDFSLNPDTENVALYASDTGGYVGCFRPAYACDVETGLSAISNVDENGTDSGSGDLLQIVNGELKFNSASSQLWNRMSDTTTINIPNGSNFKGLNAMSQDGSSFGYYIGKKQTLISPTAIAAGNALTVGKWYKVYNDNGNSALEAIIYNGVQYLPEYTFLCVTGVTTFSELEPGSGSYVKEILSGVLESIEILPYNDMTTPSTFPKFSAPLMGECKLIFYTASGAARYGKTAGDPVKFADLDLANMITDFGTVKNKISYYDTWAISNADSEFYLLTNAGLSTTLKGYFTQGIPAIKYLRREINGHFDMPYDY